MKPIAILASLLLLAGTWVQAAEGTGKDEVKSASKKLAEKGGYTWKSTVENAGGGGGGGGGGRGRMGPTEGKIDKDGMACLKLTRGDTTTEAVVHGAKGAVKTQDGWQSLEALTSDAGGGGGGGGGNPARFLARTLQNLKPPAVEAEDLAGKSKELKLADGAYSGDLTEDGAKGLLSFGGRGGGGGPTVSDASGSVKFWVKDGVLSKYQYHVKGKMSFNGNDREVDRTTTVEISEVGTTTVTVPEEAKKKLS
jgi:hypothetical protein